RAALVLMLMSPSFDFAAAAPLPSHVRYTGLIREGPPLGGGWDSPWSGDDTRPLVVASFSTNFADQRPLAERVVRALGGLPVRGLITTGPALDLDGLELPPNMAVRDFVPHAAVLPDARLVVTHGGAGTLVTALSARAVKPWPCRSSWSARRPAGPCSGCTAAGAPTRSARWDVPTWSWR